MAKHHFIQERHVSLNRAWHARDPGGVASESVLAAPHGEHVLAPRRRWICGLGWPIGTGAHVPISCSSTANIWVWSSVRSCHQGAQGHEVCGGYRTQDWL